MPLGSVDTVSPVFVVGAGRSGTTLTRLVLNGHPRLAVIGETAAFHRELKYGDLSRPWNLTRFLDDWRAIFATQSPHPGIPSAPEVLAGLRQSATFAQAFAVLMSSFAAREGKPRWGEKTPSHLLYLDSIFAAFPRTQVIHVVRDPRAVTLSTVEAFHRGRFSDAAVHRICMEWRRRVGMHEALRSLGNAYAAVRYEDLVDRPEATIERMCGFLGLEYAEGMIDFHTTSSLHTEKTLDGRVVDRHLATLRPLLTDRNERWRHFLKPRHVALIEAVAEQQIRAFGYEPISDDRPSRSALARLDAATTLHAGYRAARARMRGPVWMAQRLVDSRAAWSRPAIE